MSSNPQEGAVLFVHGIGEQRRGDTLTEFGGSLIWRAQQWLGAKNVVDVPLAVDASPRTPAHRKVDVIRPQAPPLRLLLAESHWAGDVQAPPWGALMRWLATTVPFVVQRAADAWMRQISRKVDDVIDAASGRRALALRLPLILALALVRVCANVAAVVLALVVVVALLVLGLLAKFDPVRNALFGEDPKPFPKLLQLLAVVALVPLALLAKRGDPWAVGAAIVASVPSAVVLLSLVGRLRSLVVSFIGDSYALLDGSDDGSADRIVARVERDLAWLERAAGGAPVVIVAHSQGAEVVQRVLSRRRQPPVAGLVTFGAGIAKLHAVKKLAGARRRSWFAFALRWASAACTCAAAAALAGWWEPPYELAVAGGMLALALALLWRARKILQGIVGCPDAAITIGAQQVELWTDLHASHDLVSEGRLPIPEHLGDSYAVVNRRSLLHDHLAYWHNVEGFDCAVAREIERAADERPDVAPLRALQAAARRRTRVIDALLYPARLAVVALAGWLCWQLHPDLLGVAAILAGAGLVLFFVSEAVARRIARRTDALIAAHPAASEQRANLQPA
jgi:hypothetical protein